MVTFLEGGFFLVVYFLFIIWSFRCYFVVGVYEGFTWFGSFLSECCGGFIFWSFDWVGCGFNGFDY